jgi:alkylation response protein AidB-like acyl-CoA dehydrogenase
VTTPEAHGGAGMNIAQYVEFIRKLSYAMPCYRSITSINIGMMCSAIRKSGTPEQRVEWLPRQAAGEIGSFGLTEPGSGSASAAEYEAERFFRDSRIYRIYEGTTQVLQLVIAKSMLREFAAGS